MSNANFRKHGEWNAICDRCGFKYKSGYIMKEWNGLRVCRDCFETRQPQDFVRGKAEDQSVPWTRSEQADVETDSSGWADTKTPLPPGTNNGDL